MQAYSGSTNRSANSSCDPSGNSASKNASHIPPPKSGNAGVADPSRVPKENLASARGTLHSCFCPLSSTNSKAIFESFGSVHRIPASEAKLLPDLVPLTCNCEAILCHASKIQNATSEEISCIHLASLIGWTEAEQLAAKLRLLPQRTWQELREAMNGCDRNYSARSTKRKRLSGSPAFSRNR